MLKVVSGTRARGGMGKKAKKETKKWRGFIFPAML